MLKNKPNLPTEIKDINEDIYKLTIDFYDGQSYLGYGMWYYEDYTPLTIGGNTIETSSKYIEDAWDKMLNLLKLYDLYD